MTIVPPKTQVEDPVRRSIQAFFVVFLGAVVAFLMYAPRWMRPGRSTPPAPAATEAPTGLRVGAPVVLEMPGGGGVILARDDEALTEMRRARTGRDVGRLVGAGRAFRAPNGTRAVVLREAWEARFLRVEEGPQAGWEGWAFAEFVRPAD